MNRLNKFLIIAIPALVFTSVVFAESSGTLTYNPKEMIVDYECQASKLLNLTDTPAVDSTNGNDVDDSFNNCSIRCPRNCLYSAESDYSTRKAGWYCVEDEEQDTGYLCVDGTNDPTIYTALSKVNFLGIQIDRAPLIFIRRIMLGVFGAAGLIIIAFGLVGMYKFAFSEGKQEKVQEAIKIFKSLVIGSVITFAGLVVIQVIAAVTGVTGSLLDFNFLPRTGRIVYLYQDDLGKKCLDEQIADPSSDFHYICCAYTNVWVESEDQCINEDE